MYWKKSASRRSTGHGGGPRPLELAMCQNLVACTQQRQPVGCSRAAVLSWRLSTEAVLRQGPRLPGGLSRACDHGWLKPHVSVTIGRLGVRQAGQPGSPKGSRCTDAAALLGCWGEGPRTASTLPSRCVRLLQQDLLSASLGCWAQLSTQSDAQPCLVLGHRLGLLTI